MTHWSNRGCLFLSKGLVIGLSMMPPILDSSGDDLVIPVHQTLTITCRYVSCALGATVQFFYSLIFLWRLKRWLYNNVKKNKCNIFTVFFSIPRTESSLEKKFYSEVLAGDKMHLSMTDNHLHKMCRKWRHFHCPQTWPCPLFKRKKIAWIEKTPNMIVNTEILKSITILSSFDICHAYCCQVVTHSQVFFHCFENWPLMHIFLLLDFSQHGFYGVFLVQNFSIFWKSLHCQSHFYKEKWSK